MKKIIVISFFVLGMILPNINVKVVSMGEIDVDTVTSGDGLYSDEYTPGRYVYRGVNPNNYIEFNGELWRIVAKETDRTYKIVRNEVLPEEMPFDRKDYRDSGSNGAGGTYCASDFNGCNAWMVSDNYFNKYSDDTIFQGTVLKDSTLNTYLNKDYYNNLSEESKRLIVDHNWNVGPVGNEIETYGDATEETVAIDESSIKWNGKIALLQMSDVFFANSNLMDCNTRLKTDNNNELCKTTNYLIPGNGEYWLITPTAYSTDGVFQVDFEGYFAYNSWNSDVPTKVRPAAYIDSNIEFVSGDGTKDSPYVPKEKVVNQEQNNENKQEPEVVEVPSTSAYGSIIIATLGIVCVMVSVFVMKRVTSKN